MTNIINKNKVLHIITRSDWGGAQIVCLNLATMTDKNKYEIEVACKGGGPLIEHLQANGIKVHIIDTFKREVSFFDDTKTLYHLYKLIKGTKCKIVHCHSLKAGLLGRLAAKIAGVNSVVYTIHGLGFNYKKFSIKGAFIHIIEKIFFNITTQYVCVSSNDMNYLLSKNVKFRSKCILIRNGVKLPTKSCKEEEKAILNIAKDTFVVGMIARLDHPKNPLLLLHSINTVLLHNDNVRFVLVGNGSLFASCAEYIRNNHLSDTVLLLGEMPPERVQKIMHSFDVFVLLSFWEGLPLSVIEAMFCKLPIVASNVGGIPELVFENQNGFLLHENKPDILAGLINRLIDDQALRASMGSYSAEIAHKTYGLNDMIQNYETVYENCLRNIKNQHA